MGSQYAGLLLALITTIIAPLPFILFKYGGEHSFLSDIAGPSNSGLGLIFFCFSVLARIRAASAYASATTSSDREPNEKEVAAKVGQV